MLSLTGRGALAKAADLRKALDPRYALLATFISGEREEEVDHPTAKTIGRGADPPSELETPETSLRFSCSHHLYTQTGLH
jgi:hypothetical protein